MTATPSRLRLVAAGAFFVALLVIIVLRAAQLTVIQGQSLRDIAERQHHQRLTLQPERGAVVDRNGDHLALSVDAASIYVRPAEFRARPAAVAGLASVLGLDESAVEHKMQKSSPFVWLKRQASPGEQAAVQHLDVPGVGMQLGSRRIYPHGDLAAPLLGLTNVDGRGLEGIELQLDRELRGEGGAVVVERDARGRRMMTDGIWRPLPREGATVELTIDSNLQHVAEIELARGVSESEAEAGLAVVMDPKTGEILALAQVPRFDPNAPERSPVSARRNRAVTDSFEPGSTMKAFVAAAALENGVVRPDEKLYCEHGRYHVGRRTVRDHEPYDWLTFTEVIEYSSNICSAKVGERLGRDRLGAALRAFGFGQPTGVDMPGEVPGLFVPPEKWSPIRLVTTSFGQGIAVTLMQMARGYAALANGGRLMHPYVVKRVIAADGTVLRAAQPRVDGRPVSAATARTVTALLETVVESGTGTKAQIPGIRVAGKTGTAQKANRHGRGYSPRDRIGSFIGYAPADDPRIVVAVMIDTPRKATYGGVVAAPVFRRIAETALERLGVRRRSLPAEPPPAPGDLEVMMRPQSVALTMGPYAGVPNVLGLGMRDAVTRLGDAGLRPLVEGWGVVQSQDPPPGAEIQPGREVRLQLGSELH